MKQLKYIFIFLMVASSLFAVDEIPFDHFSGSTLYFIRYLPNGNVLLPNGTNEVYGTGGRDADDYDTPMPESGSSGHYVGDFDNPNNIADGFYNFVIFEQFGGSPADTDQPAIGYGTLHWKDFAEDFESRQSDSAVTDAHLIDIKGTGFVKDTHSLIDLYTLLIFAQDWLEADEFIDDSNPAQFQIVTTKKQSGGGGAELGRKNYKDIDGDPIINLRTVFAETQEP